MTNEANEFGRERVYKNIVGIQKYCWIRFVTFGVKFNSNGIIKDISITFCGFGELVLVNM